MEEGGGQPEEKAANRDRNTINVGSCHQSESAAQKKPQHQQKTRPSCFDRRMGWLLGGKGRGERDEAQRLGMRHAPL